MLSLWSPPKDDSGFLLQRQFMVLLFLAQASSSNTQCYLVMFFSDGLNMQLLVSPALLGIM